MAKMHVKHDDVVVVISGADKGRQGAVLSVDRKKNRVIVEGVNRRKHAVRRSQDNPRGGIEEREQPIHISNVMALERYRASGRNQSGTTTVADEVEEPATEAEAAAEEESSEQIEAEEQAEEQDEDQKDG